MSPSVMSPIEVGGQDASRSLAGNAHHHKQEAILKKSASARDALINPPMQVRGVGTNPIGCYQGLAQLVFRHLFMAYLDMLGPCAGVQRDFESVRGLIHITYPLMLRVCRMPHRFPGQTPPCQHRGYGGKCRGYTGYCIPWGVRIPLVYYRLSKTSRNFSSSRKIQMRTLPAVSGTGNVGQHPWQVNGDYLPSLPSH